VTTARLAYSLALDLAHSALQTGRAPGDSSLFIASTPVFADEARIRADAASTLVEAWPDTHQERALPGGTFAGAIWAAPTSETWHRWLALLDDRLVRGSRLMVLLGGPGTALLSRLQAAREPGEPTWGGRPLCAELARRAYAVRGIAGLGSVSSIFWAALARAAAGTGRHDIVDRAEIGYRQSMVGPGSRLFTNYRLLVCEKQAQTW
jgi:hypothetical protein